MLNIHFDYDSGLNTLDERLKLAIAAKLTELTEMMYQKVIENVSGKILQKKSGQLAGSIQQTVDTSGEVMIGSVFPEPASPKAWALEKGGEKSYLITPSKATVLKFYWDKMAKTVFLQSVDHPPSKEYAYLRLALADMEAIVPEEFQATIQRVLDGR